MINKLLKDLRGTTKSSEKIKLLQEFPDQKLLHKVFLYTYDLVNYTYGIKKIPENKGSIFGLDAQKLEASNLISLLDRLVDRTYTGNEAIEYLDYVLNSAKLSGYYDLICCIINHDLDAGVNEGIIKKLFPDIIKKPKIQLISAFDQDKIEKKIKYPAFAQLKVDGARAICIKENNTIKILTRSGNEYHGLDHIKNALQKHSGSFVLDGEIIYNPNPNKSQNTFETSPEDRQLSNGIVNKSVQGTISEQEAKNLQYVVWDYIDFDEYQTESKKTLYFERFNKLNEIENNNSIIKVDSVKINSLQEAKDLYQKYREHGYEGIILKNSTMKWEDKRSPDAYKFKDEFDVDLVITGYEVHSKDSTKLGSVYAETSCGKLKVSVGSGFKDSKNNDIHDRTGALLEAKNGNLIGKIITVRANSIIKSQNKEEYSLFLPRLICFRFDKTDANSLEEI